MEVKEVGLISSVFLVIIIFHVIVGLVLQYEKNYEGTTNGPHVFRRSSKIREIINMTFLGDDNRIIKFDTEIKKEKEDSKFIFEIIPLSTILTKKIHITDKNITHLQFEEQWKLQNPNWEFIKYDDDQVKKIILENFPMFDPIYKNLLPVETADLFRYVVLYVYGGLYADSDVEPFLSIDLWLPLYRYELSKVDAVIGIEFPVKSLFQFNQWCILSKRGAPFLGVLVENIYHTVRTISTSVENVEDRTGPHIWTTTLHNYIAKTSLSRPGLNETGFANALLPPDELNERHKYVKIVNSIEENGQIVKLKDMNICILPYRALGYNNRHKRWKRKRSNNDKKFHLVEHWFASSWKKK